MRRLIGQCMLEANLIDQRQLNEALEYQKLVQERVPLGKLTVKLGLVGEEEFALFLAAYFDVPYFDLNGYLAVQKEAIEVVPEPIAKKFNVLPVLKENGTLVVAVSDPLDLVIFENLEIVTHYRIKLLISTPTKIKEGIEIMYKMHEPKKKNN